MLQGCDLFCDYYGLMDVAKCQTELSFVMEMKDSSFSCLLWNYMVELRVV